MSLLDLDQSVRPARYLPSVPGRPRVRKNPFSREWEVITRGHGFLDGWVTVSCGSWPEAMSVAANGWSS